MIFVKSRNLSLNLKSSLKLNPKRSRSFQKLRNLKPEKSLSFSKRLLKRVKSNKKKMKSCQS